MMSPLPIKAKPIGNPFKQEKAKIFMTEEMDFDCEACEYQEVCEEAEELQDMRKSLMAARSGEDE